MSRCVSCGSVTPADLGWLPANSYSPWLSGEEGKAGFPRGSTLHHVISSSQLVDGRHYKHTQLLAGLQPASGRFPQGIRCCIRLDAAVRPDLLVADLVAIGQIMLFPNVACSDPWEARLCSGWAHISRDLWYPLSQSSIDLDLVSFVHCPPSSQPYLCGVRLVESIHLYPASSQSPTCQWDQRAVPSGSIEGVEYRTDKMPVSHFRGYLSQPVLRSRIVQGPALESQVKCRCEECMRG